MREPQLAGPYYIATASFALWRGDVADASRSVDRAGTRPRDRGVGARRADGLDGRPRSMRPSAPRRAQNRQLPPLAAARQRTTQVVERPSRLVAPRASPTTAGSRRVAEASLATARAYQRRLEGEDSGATWARSRVGWAALDAPYDVALARWRQAEATLAGATAARPGRRPGAAARGGRLALRLGARPLLRELRELAGRARIRSRPRSTRARRAPGRRAEPVAAGRQRRRRRARRSAQRPSDLVRAIAGDPPRPARAGRTRSA